MPPKRKRVVVHDVDANGDVVIQAGRPGLRTLIRVSKEALVDASPVFGAMLGPNFAEGQVQHTVEKPLKLHDDDGAIMLVLLKIIHQKLHDPGQVNVDRLEYLVLMGDKYSCFELLRPWLLFGLGRMRERYGRDFSTNADRNRITILDALYIAYLIDDGASFEWLSHELFHLVQGVSGDPSSNSIHKLSSVLSDLMPDDFKGMFSNRLRAMALN
jgi:hypothetical protein